jgi:acyl carrier protein
MHEINTILTSILYNDLGITAEKNDLDISFIDLGLDSIALLEFQFVVAKHYSIDENELNLKGDESLLILEKRLIAIKKGIEECATPSL